VQAEATRAQNARNLQVARARVALLPELPINTNQPAGAPQRAPETQAPAAPSQTPGTGQQFATTTSTTGAQTGGFR